MPPSSSKAVAGPQVQLVARAPDESTRIDVYDGDLHRVETEQNLGELTLTLPPGVYCVTFTRGNDSLRKTVVLGKTPVTVSLSEDEAPRFATPAPVRKTSSTRETHRIPARNLSLKAPMAPPAGQAGGSRLLVFARDLDPLRTGDPAHGLSLRDINGKLLYDIASTDQRNASENWAGAHLDLDPGPYLLRSESRQGRITEQPIYTCAGWQTQVFLLSRAAGGESNERRTDLSNVSQLMAKSARGFDFEREDLRWTEVALSALESNGNIPGTMRTEMQWAKFENPMLGIFAALLQLRRQKIDPGSLREAVLRLLDLVGPLPDVLAIGWALAERDESVLKDATIKTALSDPKGLETPPMLAESWTHLMRACEHRPSLIPPGSLSDRVGDLKRPRGPWFAWQGEPPGKVDLENQTADLMKVAKQTAEGASTGRAEKSSGLANAILKMIEEPLSAITASLIVPWLSKLLSDTPEIGYWLVSRRYTDLERRVAFFVYPQAAPAVRELMEASKTIAKTLSEQELKGDSSVKNAVEALGVPPSTLLRATWSMLTKLLVQPIVPIKAGARSFADSEAHGADALLKILLSLADLPTPLRPHAGPLHAKALAFLCLYYRGSPAYPSGTKHNPETLASFLHDSEYVWSDELATVTADRLARHVDLLRDRLIGSIADAVKDKLELDAGWQKHVLPALSSYERGKLLPLPHQKPTPATTGAPLTSTSARKWTGIPHGSWLELKIDGEHVVATALFTGAGADRTWSHDAVVLGKRQKLRASKIYDLRIEVAFELASSAEVACRIVKPDGTTYGKPYRLELSGNAGDVAHAEIRALTAKA